MAAVLFLSLCLRLTGIEWDGVYHLHPDERYIVWVGTTVEFPTDWKSAFDPELSTFNPFHWAPEAKSSGIRVQQGEPRSFAYGHWPLYLGVAATHLLEKGESWGSKLPAGWTLARNLLNASGRIEYRHMLLVGRALAALFDTLTVWLVFLIGRRIFTPLVGLLAAAFVALSVLQIQQAHFFVTDPFLTTAVVAALYWMVRRVGGPRPAASSRRNWRDGLAAGAFVGLAVGAKFSAIMLVLPLLVAFIWRRRVPPVAKGAKLRRRLKRWWHWARRPAAELAAALLLGAVVFAFTNPFALLDNSCQATLGGYRVPLVKQTIPTITVHSCYLKNIGTQAAMVRGGNLIPFTYQYIGTPPYLYYLDQAFRWGLGAPLTLASFGGLIWAIWRMIWKRRETDPGEAVLLAWALPFFIVTGSFQVKFLRYLLPLTPLLAIYAAGMLSCIGVANSGTGPGRCAALGAQRKNREIWRLGHLSAGYLVLAGTLVSCALWAATFVGLYHVGEHPWVAASRWLVQHAPANSTVATEHWDHALPLNLRDGERKSLRSVTLEWYNVEDRMGRETSRVELGLALQQVADSDYLVLASNRLYGVIPRLPERYPEASAYYQLLFSGDLGWELVYWNGRYPTLGTVALVDDTFGWPGLLPPAPLAEWQPAPITLNLGPADESFTVYDHPLVLIFENRGQLGAEEMESLVRERAIGD